MEPVWAEWRLCGEVKKIRAFTQHINTEHSAQYRHHLCTQSTGLGSILREIITKSRKSVLCKQR